MKSFSELRSQSNNLEKITKQLAKTEGKKDFSDDRYWQPQVDKAGNGTATIRFLPASKGEELPYVKIYSHGFQTNAGWVIDNCQTTLGNPCPICEWNGQTIAEHGKSEEDPNSGLNQVRKRGSKRKLNYIANILVVNDPANPENNGKVFLFKFGTKIFEKYMACISPKFEGDEAYLPYDLWEGADFQLRISKKAGFRNYDESKFSARSVVKLNKKALNDEQLEQIWEQQHSLNGEIAPEKFKAYDALKAILTKKLNGAATAKTVEATLEEHLGDKAVSAPKVKSVKAPKNDADDTDLPWEPTTSPSGVDADDLESLKSLIEED